jgi:hypothetical protein
LTRAKRPVVSATERHGSSSSTLKGSHHQSLCLGRGGGGGGFFGPGIFLVPGLTRGLLGTGGLFGFGLVFSLLIAL